MSCKKVIEIDSFCNWAKSPIVKADELSNLSRIYQNRIALYEYNFNKKCK